MPDDDAELARADTPRIKFGPKPHQELSPDVASMMLTLWRERNPAHFGAVLAEAMTGEPPRTGRRRPA